LPSLSDESTRLAQRWPIKISRAFPQTQECPLKTSMMELTARIGELCSRFADAQEAHGA
jgi:hypothetical protein